jgi:hypothetical protein
VDLANKIVPFRWLRVFDMLNWNRQSLLGCRVLLCLLGLLGQGSLDARVEALDGEVELTDSVASRPVGNPKRKV